MPDSITQLLSSPQGIAILVGILLAVLMTNACHEGGHALAAYFCGDRRRSIWRRCTLNPINHFHWFLSGVLPLLSMYFLGWTLGGARPVMLDLSRLTPGRLALVALAGPLGNFLFAGVIIAVVGFCLAVKLIDPLDPLHSTAWRILKPAVWYSAFLGLLNLIPLPPLDGSRVVSLFMPEKVRRIWFLLAPAGLLVFLAAGLWMSGQLARFGLGNGHPEVFVAIETTMESWLFVMYDFWREIL